MKGKKSELMEQKTASKNTISSDDIGFFFTRKLECRVPADWLGMSTVDSRPHQCGVENLGLQKSIGTAWYGKIGRRTTYSLISKSRATTPETLTKLQYLLRLSWKTLGVAVIHFQNVNTTGLWQMLPCLDRQSACRCLA